MFCSSEAPAWPLCALLSSAGHTKLDFALFLLCSLHISNSLLACFYPFMPFRTFSSYCITVNRLMMVDFDTSRGSSPSMQNVNLHIFLSGNRTKSFLNYPLCFLYGFPLLFPPVVFQLYSYCLFSLSHNLSICMLTNAISAPPCLLGGGNGVGVEWAEPVATAAYQPVVRAGTVGSVLTSACHFGPDYSF